MQTSDLLQGSLAGVKGGPSLSAAWV